MKSNVKLDLAARQLSRGLALKEATRRAEYQAQRSAVIHVRAPDEARMAGIAAEKFCSLLLDKEFQDIGLFRRGDEAWIVLAVPFNTRAIANTAEVSREVLDLVNRARARPRRCGREAFNAAPPLTLNAVLERAALEHARDMAAHDYISHQGRDGSRPEQRVSRTGYRWSMVGENIAIGLPTAQSVMEGWLASPEHCANIMTPGFKEMAVAYALNPNSESGIYWTQVFGTPRK